ncbi:MAG: hypothetical protein DRO52_00970 [Candidatus Hecatellales archaeon]|nr:MAG: hypothetical protein DRO52_00970 [Candidatus Hecatellales archaeon]
MKLVNIRFFEGGQAHESFIRNGIKIRMQVLKHVRRGEAERVAEALGGFFLDPPPLEDSSIEWALAFEPLKNFRICFLMRRNEPEFEDELQILYDVEGLPFLPPAEDVADFTLLYANAIIYAVRKVLGREDIPGISSYL